MIAKGTKKTEKNNYLVNEANVTEIISIILNFLAMLMPITLSMWKFVKGELLIEDYDDFSLFKEKISSIINSTTHVNHAKMCRLIGEKGSFLIPFTSFQIMLLRRLIMMLLWSHLREIIFTREYKQPGGYKNKRRDK